MEKFFRVLTLLTNLCLLGVVFGLWSEHRPYGGEVLLYVLLVAAPLLNLWAIWTGPDLEERKLRRAVAKAELRQRLKELDSKAG